MTAKEILRLNGDVLTFDEEIHCYALNGVKMAGVSSILKRAGLIDLSGIPEEVLNRARDFGIATHAVCELHDKGTLDVRSISEPIIPYYQAYNAFLNDYKPEEMEIEQAIFSKTWWYAGRPDRFARIQGFKTCYDIKSTASMAPTTRLQMGGYVIGYQEMYPGKEKIKRMGLLLKKDGTYQVYPYDDDADIQVFKAALTVSKWKRKFMPEKYNGGEKK